METVKFLIAELNFNPFFENVIGCNCFLHACAGGNIEVVKYLINKFPELSNSTTNNQFGAVNGLQLASLFGNLKTVIYLIEFGMDPAVMERNCGLNSFLFACTGKITGKMEGKVKQHLSHSKIVKYLSSHFPELVNSSTCNGDNGLHLASRSGNLEIVKFLIDELHFDPTVGGDRGTNSFFQACRPRRTEIVNFFAEKYSTFKNCSVTRCQI